MFQKPAFVSTTTNFEGEFGQQQQQQTGTAHVNKPVGPVVGAEAVVKEGIFQNVNIKFQCITRMETGSPQCENKVIVCCPKCDTEVSHTAKGIQEKMPATTSAPSVFGSGAGFTQQPPSASFSFGNNAQSTNTTGLFGANKPAFGAPPTTGSTGLFGATTTQAATFGTSSSTFGFSSTTQLQQPPGNLLFGAKTHAPSIGIGTQAPGGTGLFGATTTQAPTCGTSTSTFGFSSTTQLQQPPGNLLFGAKTQAPSIGIGTQAPGGTGLFGATTTQAPTFGTSTSTFGYSSTTQLQQPPGSLLFGGAKPASTGLGECGAKTQTPNFGTQVPDFSSMTTGAFVTTKKEEIKKLSPESFVRPEYRMETKEVTQKGNILKARLTVSKLGRYETLIHTSREFVINGVALFQVRLETSNYMPLVGSSKLSVRFTKRRHDDELTYIMYFNSETMNIVGKTMTCDDGTWHLIHEDKILWYTFHVSVEMRLQSSASSFAGLHEDTELLDFELRGEDGGVRIHRVVLAAASPVLRRMLGGEWRETAEGHVDVTGTSKATLEHLKTYVYLHELPESGLEKLLLLSSYYIMPELEQLCVDRLVRDVSAQNACDLIELAVKNNVKRLLFAVLECVQTSVISVSEMRNHCDVSNDAPNTGNT